ncbi:hypothetical protein [Nonlabens agnitus]|uniref:Uncharacterized protein n=1 Tax=Nonlabens agnitus TaxID=870484 RepID=A0A2S9WVD3_9FLAO|nr:hypothetical protein [Nonlabens agnitus]PRP67432.1 hypothetical protein BST86_10175 [Nonlabens agnitus]
MSTLYLKINQDWNQNFVGYSAIAIIVSTCLGAFAIMTSMMGETGKLQMFLVFIVVAACSIHNASILTVQKPDTVLKLLIASVVISIVVILTNLFIL